MDLNAIYLQARVAPEQWKYQLVKYKGKTYCLTRLGFGLSSAPMMMSKILKYVLGLKKDVMSGTSSFIDDILVDQSVVSSENVACHLKKFGSVAKSPEKMEGGIALGLRISRSRDGVLIFTRGTKSQKKWLMI